MGRLRWCRGQSPPHFFKNIFFSWLNAYLTPLFATCIRILIIREVTSRLWGFFSFFFWFACKDSEERPPPLPNHFQNWCYVPDNFPKKHIYWNLMQSRHVVNVLLFAQFRYVWTFNSKKPSKIVKLKTVSNYINFVLKIDVLVFVWKCRGLL